MRTRPAPKYNYIVPPEVINGVKFPGLIRASEIQVREMEWLWFPYLPMGAASMIFGPGGHGKSHIAVDIAAALTMGNPLPGQTGPQPKRQVLMLSAEDEPELVLGPRLLRAGADMEKIGFPQDPFVLNTAGVQRLEGYLKNFDASVVFIDPVVHYIGGKVDMNKANEVRAAIGVFHQMAMRHDLSIILVGHSRKGQEGEDYEKSMGSADFNNAVRSVMFVTRAPDGTRVMKHVKANYSALGPSLAYQFGHNGVGSFEWLGVYEGDDTMLGVNVSARRKKRTAIAELLKKWLANGPVRSKDIEKLAEAEGFSYRTIHRTKDELGIESLFHREVKDSAKGSAWWMRLPGDTRQPGEAGVEPPDGQPALPTVDSGREGGEPRPSAKVGRQGDGSPVDEGEGAGDEGPAPAVGSGGPDQPEPDAKAIAAAFLKQRGLPNG